MNPAEVSTLTLLVTAPDLPRRSIVTLIGTFDPGANLYGVVGNCATVQPQEVRRLLMEISAFETFVTMKVNGALCSPGLAL